MVLVKMCLTRRDNTAIEFAPVRWNREISCLVQPKRASCILRQELRTSSSRTAQHVKAPKIVRVDPKVFCSGRIERHMRSAPAVGASISQSFLPTSTVSCPPLFPVFTVKQVLTDSGRSNSRLIDNSLPSVPTRTPVCGSARIRSNPEQLELLQLLQVINLTLQDVDDSSCQDIKLPSMHSCTVQTNRNECASTAVLSLCTCFVRPNAREIT